MKKSLALASAIVISSAVWLAAPATAYEGHGNGACKADVEKFCSDVSGGRRAVGECLHDHQSDLSTECQAKLCGDVEHGQIKDCLQSHESEVSDGCRAAMKPQS